MPSRTDNDKAEAAALSARVDKDLTVRNMPRLNTFASAPAKPKDEGPGALSFEKPRQDFRLVGFLIIIGGIIVILGLLWLGYAFIIKPQASPKTQAPAAENKKQEMAGPADTQASSYETLTASTTPVATTTPVEEVASTTLATTSEQDVMTPLTDTDADGLNDEEELVLGTNVQAADTNGNSYPDLTEVSNDYNPTGTGRISSLSSLASYKNSVYGYTMLYPKNWEPKPLAQESTVTFTADDSSIIQVSAQENDGAQSILGWYGDNFPDEVVTYDKLKSGQGWDGIWGADGLNFYFTDSSRKNIYIVSYVPATEGRLAYPDIFGLMIRSINLK